jgi:hypothetical protein
MVAATMAVKAVVFIVSELLLFFAAFLQVMLEMVAADKHANREMKTTRSASDDAREQETQWETSLRRNGKMPVPVVWAYWFPCELWVSMAACCSLHKQKHGWSWDENKQPRCKSPH